MAENHYFIGIPLEQECKEWLASWQEELRKEEDIAYQNWPHPQDLHITLKFLGGIKEERIRLLSEKLDKMEQEQSFRIKIGQLGVFGRPSRPRVLWVGAEKNEALATLQQNIEQICRETGFPAENRPYRPHVTLAKKWKGSKEFPSRLKNRYSEQRKMKVSCLVLYQIHPASVPKYKIIHEVGLK